MPRNRGAIGRAIAGLCVLALASTACSGKSAGGGAPTRSPGDIWEQIKHAGEASEFVTPTQLGDLGSLADAVVIGRVTAYNGVTHIPPGSADGKGAGVAHFTVSVDKVILGTVNSPTPTELPLVMLVSSGPKAFTSEDGVATHLAAAALPAEPVLLSLIQNIDPAYKNSGFYSEYSPPSRRGIIQAEADGSFSLPIAASSFDGAWAKETLVSPGLDDLGAAIVAAASRCRAAPNSCQKRASG